MLVLSAMIKTHSFFLSFFYCKRYVVTRVRFIQYCAWTGGGDIVLTFQYKITLPLSLNVNAPSVTSGGAAGTAKEKKLVSSSNKFEHLSKEPVCQQSPIKFRVPTILEIP